MQTTNAKNPSWWTHTHDSSWQFARDNVKREWTAPDEQWRTSEADVRYGYGAATHYTTERDWNDTVEAKLREEWNDLKSGKTWDDVKSSVRRGWDAARGQRRGESAR